MYSSVSKLVSVSGLDSEGLGKGFWWANRPFRGSFWYIQASFGDLFASWIPNGAGVETPRVRCEIDRHGGIVGSRMRVRWYVDCHWTTPGQIFRLYEPRLVIY